MSSWSKAKALQLLNKVLTLAVGTCRSLDWTRTHQRMVSLNACTNGVSCPICKRLRQFWTLPGTSSSKAIIQLATTRSIKHTARETHDDSWRQAQECQQLRLVRRRLVMQWSVHLNEPSWRTWPIKVLMRATLMRMLRMKKMSTSQKNTNMWLWILLKTCTSKALWSRCRSSLDHLAFPYQRLAWYWTTRAITCCTLSTLCWAGASSTLLTRLSPFNSWTMAIS